MNKEVVKELIQDELTEKNLAAELEKLLNNREKQKQIRSDYKALYHLLSEGGHASAKAAASIIATAKKLMPQ